MVHEDKRVVLTCQERSCRWEPGWVWPWRDLDQSGPGVAAPADRQIGAAPWQAWPMAACPAAAPSAARRWAAALHFPVQWVTFDFAL